MGRYVNLKITFKMSQNSDVVLPNSAFDSVLARLYFDKQKSENTFNGDYDQELPFLEKSDGVYHTSFPIAKVKAFQNRTITKSFDKVGFASTGGKISSAMEEIKKGRYKAWFESFEAMIVDKVVYYVRGDIDVIYDLLKGLRYLGKKASIGMGKIKETIIEEIKDDYSLVQNNSPMRNLPSIEKYNNLNNSSKVLMPLNPPYWKNYRNVECIVSNSFIDEVKQ